MCKKFTLSLIIIASLFITDAFGQFSGLHFSDPNFCYNMGAQKLIPKDASGNLLPLGGTWNVDPWIMYNGPDDYDFIPGNFPVANFSSIPPESVEIKYTVAGKSYKQDITVWPSPPKTSLLETDATEICNSESYGDLIVYNTSSSVRYIVLDNLGNPIGIDSKGNGGTLLLPVFDTGTYSITSRTEYPGNYYCYEPVPGNVELIRNPEPTPSFEVSKISVCKDEVVRYETQQGMQNYNWLFNSTAGVLVSGGGINDYFIEIKWLVPGTYSDAVSINYGFPITDCHAVDATTLNITVNDLPIPQFDLLSDASVCVNATGIYTTDAGKTNYVWSISPGGAIVTANPENANSIEVLWSVVSTSQWVRVSYTETATGCTPDPSVVIQYDVVVHDRPNYSIDGDAIVCENGDYTYGISEADASNFQWTVSGGGTALTPLTGASTITVRWASAGSVSVNYTNANGCEPTVDPSMTVQVNPLPIPDINLPRKLVVCQNEIVNYSTQPGMSGYDWTVIGGTILSGDNAATVQVQWTDVLGGRIFVNYVQTTSGVGCLSAAPVEYDVTVNALPIPTITEDPANSSCWITGTETFKYWTETGSGINGWDWTLVSAGTIVSGGDGNNFIEVRWAAAGDNKLSVTYKNANDCSPTAPTEYTDVLSTVNTTINIDAPLSNIICEGTQVTFIASGSNGSGTYNYQFYKIRQSDGAVLVVQPFSALTTFQTPTTDPLLNGDKVYVIVRDMVTACEAKSVEVTMTVNAKPALTLFNDTPLSICQGATVTFHSTPAGLNKYVYYVGATPYDNGANPVFTTPALASNTTVHVIGTNASGCSATTPTQNVAVTPTPVVAPLTYTSPTGSTTVCESSTVSFNALSGADVYTIELESVGLTPMQKVTLRTKGNNAAFTVTAMDHFTNATGFIVRVIGYNGTLECPSVPVTTTFTINKPTVQFVNPITTICEGADATFTASGTGAVEYIFFVNNVLGVPVQNWSASNSVTISGLVNNDIVYVQSRSASPLSCPSAFAQVTISTVALPIPSVDAIAPICALTPVTVQANPAGMSQYVFHVDRGGIVTNYNRGANSTLPISTLQNNDVVSVTVTAASGCSATSTGKTVSVTDIPVVAPLTYTSPTGSTTVCESSTVSFDALSGADTYTIELVSVGLSPTQTVTLRNKGNNAAFTVTATDYFTNATGFIVRVTGYNGALECASVPVTTTFTINKPTVQFVNPITTICEGADATFTASGIGAVEYIFFVNNVLGVPVQNWSASNSVTISGLVSNDIVYVQSRSASPLSCPSEFAQVTISTVALPTPSVDAIAPICASTPVTVQANPAGMSQYVFHVDRGGIVTDYNRGANSTLPNLILQNNDVVSVTVTAASGCSATSTGKTVSVTDIPVVAPLTYTSPTGSTTVCESSTVSFDALSGADVYTIELVSVGLTPTQTVTLRNKGNNAAFTVTATDYFTNATGFIVRVTGYNGALECASVPVTSTFIIDIPTASFVAPASSVCDGSNLTLTATGINAVEYRFFIDNTITPVQDWSALNTFDHIYTAANNGQIVYVQTRSALGCTSDIVAGPTMIVHPIPAKALLTSSELTVCANGSIHYEITSPVLPNASYNFIIDGDVANPVVSTIPQYTISNKTTDYTVSAYVISEYGCQSPVSDVISIDVIEPFAMTLNITNGVGLTLCEGTVVDLAATGADTYQFSVDGVLQGAGPSPTATFSYTSTATTPDPVIVVIGYKNGLTGCPGSATLTLHVDKPTASFVLAPSTACDNSNLTMSATGTGAAEYRFFIDNTITPVQDWSALNTFDHIYTSANNGQVVYVQSRSAFPLSCTSDIVAGPTMTVNPLPTASIALAIGSSNPVCANENVTFEASTDFGDSYQFNINGSPVAGAIGTTFTSNSLSNGDIITVLITNSATGCSQLSNQIVMTVNPLPTAGLNVIQGSTNIIDGTLVEFQGTGGVDYNFEVTRGGVVVITQAFSNDDTFDNTTLQNGDVVTVTVRDANGCLDTESLTMTVLDQIVPQLVDANPFIYCIDDANGFDVWVNNPQAGVSYELIRTDDNTNLGIGTFDGTVVRWNDILNSTSGNNTYKVEAFYPSVPATRIDMSNTVVIHRHDLPQVYALTVSPISGCINQFGLSNSELGITYQLFADATLLSTIVVDGIIQPAGVLDFGTHNLTGVTYHVVASFSNLNTCDQPMTGDYAVASIAAQQLVTANPANGMYCQGGAGVTITLNGSEAGMSYWLQYNGVDVAGSEFISPANGATNTFAVVTADGTYRVVARVGGCDELMTNQSVTVQTIAPHPAMTLVPATSEYCEDVNGLTLTLSGFVTGYEYALIKDGGAAVYNNYDAFTSFPFDNQTDGSYSVRARHIASGCEDVVATAVIVENSLPTDVQIQADATVYCAGSTVRLFIPSSENGVRYDLILDGTATGQSVTSDTDNKPYEFFVGVAGTYTVHAINTITGCERDLTGSVTITESPLPLIKVYSVVNGTDCNNGDIVTLTDPEVGVTYSIYSKVTNLPRPGYSVTAATTDPIVFNQLFDNGGIYYVVAESSFGCTQIMDYDLDDSVNPDEFDVTIPGIVRSSEVRIPAAICLGDGGVVIEVVNAQNNVNYSLRLSGVNVETILNTTEGTTLQFTQVFSEGIYDVVGVENLGTCENSMLNTVTIKYNPLPISYKLNTSSGIYCDATAGATIELASSEAGGVTYYLMLNDPINGLQLKATKESWTVETPFVFNGITTPGNYTVYAKNSFGCTSNMENIVKVEQRNQPANTYVMSSIDECSIDGKVGISITGHENDVIYTIVSAANDTVFNGTITLPTAFTRLAEGTYTTTASWGNGHCVQTPQTLVVLVPVIPTAPAITINGNSSDISVCGATETVTVQVVTPVAGLFYSLWQLDAVNGWVIHTAATAASDGVAAQEWIVSGGVATEGTFRVNASSYLDGSCPSTSNDLKYTMAAKPSLLTVSQSLTGDCSSDGKADLMISAYEANVIYTIVDKATSNVVFSGVVINTTPTADGLYYLTRLGIGNYSVSASFGGNIACATPLNDVPIAVSPLPVSPVITINDQPYAYEVCGVATSVNIKVTNLDPALYYTLYKIESDGSSSIVASSSLIDVNGWNITATAATGDVYYATASQVPSGLCASNRSNSVYFLLGIAPAQTNIWAADLGYCVGEKGIQVGVLNPDLKEVVYRLVRVISENAGVMTYEHIEYLMTNASDVSKYQYTLESDPNFPSTVYLPFKSYVQTGVYAVLASYPYGDCSSYVEMVNRLVVYEKGESECSKLIAINDYLFLNGEDVSRSLNVFYDEESKTDLDIRNPVIDFYNTEVETPNLEFVLLDAACYEDEECKATRKDKQGVNDPFYGNVSLNKTTGEFTYTKVFGFYGTETIEYIVRNLDHPDSRVDTATITILVGNKDFHDNGTLLIPNAMSPNGDTYNDEFIITGNVDFDEEDGNRPINISDDNVFSTLEVYNRWGTMVYKSKKGQYGEDDEWWDGKGNAGAMVSIGSDLPVGTYFYIFKVSYNKTNGTPKTQHYNGFVELRR